MDAPVTPGERDRKAALRLRLAEAWRTADLAATSAAVTARLLDLPELARARCVAAYAAMPGELDVGVLVEELHTRGVQVLLPVLEPDGALGWRVHDPRVPLVAGRRGTSEPPALAPTAQLSDADAAIVPGLGYDAAGRRLGRGGGSYDRALATLPRAVVRIGVAPDTAVVALMPVEPHDAPVDVVVTPTRVMRADR